MTITQTIFAAGHTCLDAVQAIERIYQPRADQLRVGPMLDAAKQLPDETRGPALDALLHLEKQGLTRSHTLNLTGAAAGVLLDGGILESLITLHRTGLLNLNNIVFEESAPAGHALVRTDFAGFIALHASDSRDNALNVATRTPAQMLERLAAAHLLTPQSLPRSSRSALDIALQRDDHTQWIPALLAQGFDLFRRDPLEAKSTLQVALTHARVSPEQKSALIEHITPAALELMLSRQPAIVRSVFQHILETNEPRQQQWLTRSITASRHPASALKALVASAVSRGVPMPRDVVKQVLSLSTDAARANRLYVMAREALRLGHRPVFESLCRNGLACIQTPVAQVRVLHRLINDAIAGTHDRMIVSVLSLRLPADPEQGGLPIDPQTLVGALRQPLHPDTFRALVEHIQTQGFFFAPPGQQQILPERQLINPFDMAPHRPFLQAITQAIAADAQRAERLASLPIKLAIALMILTLGRATIFPFPLSFTPTLLELRWCDLPWRNFPQHCFDALDRRDEAMLQLNEWRSRVGVTGMLAADVVLLMIGFVTASAVRLTAQRQQALARQSIRAARGVIQALNDPPPPPV